MTEKPNDPVVTFKVTSNPFLGDPEGADEFYAAVGRMLMVWGRFETQPDYTLRAIIGLPEGRPILDLTGGTFPVSMKK